MAQRQSIAQAQLDAARQFLSERVRRQPPEEESLQLPDVLEEELAYLEGLKEPPPKWREWSVRPQDILDPADFARKLHAAQKDMASTIPGRNGTTADATRDISKTLLGAHSAGGEGLSAAFRAYMDADQPGVELANRLKEQIAGRMNELLDETELCFYPGFATLQLDAHGEALRLTQLTTVGGRHRELNRLLFETAYPSQLAKVRDGQLSRLYAQARAQGNAALCLSGGGIRSATFGLGVLQGFARLGLLNRFRYMSTVSGGGYLGSWLSAWMMRSGPTHVAQALSHVPREKLQPEPAPIRHLRAFSNFLSPKFGALSADTWTLLATYVRNLWINWLVSVPLLAAVIFVPYAARAVVDSQPEHWGVLGGWPLPAALVLIGALLAAQSVRFVHASRPQSDAHRPRKQATGTDAFTSVRPSQERFLARCLLPLVLSTVLLTTAWQLFRSWGLVHDDTPDAVSFGLSRVPVVREHFALTAFILVGAIIHVVGWLFARRRSRHPFIEFSAIVVTGGLAGVAAHLFADLMQLPVRPAQNDDMYVVLAMPVFLMVMVFGSQLFLAWTSSKSQDPEREWGARFNAWVLIVAVSWLVSSGLVLLGPPLLLQRHTSSARYLLTLMGGWSGLTTIVLGWSAKTGAKSSGREPTRMDAIRRVALGVAAPLFAVTIIVLIAALDGEMIRRTCQWRPAECVRSTTIDVAGRARTAVDLTRPAPRLPLALGGALMALGLAFGRRIDTNKFSLHAMYRARLIRAYLGASRPGGERNPDPFTGFDEFDNLRMKDLWPASSPADERTAATGSPNPPLHVINVALNLVGGRNLAWQERKAESFTVTALHAGSPFTGYRRTSPARGDADRSAVNTLAAVTTQRAKPRLYGDDRGLSLGTAMTISGAAANPSMGYHSSPAVTFLLTLFNARLGWWLGNPGPAGRKTFDRAAPRLTAGLIVRELFGLTNDRAHYVQLSDGGHFDNLGLYEMVLRRCKYIVVVDASGDASCGFDDLGNSIRKIRIDLGVPVDFEGPMHIHARGKSLTPGDVARYWAVAKIRYSCVDAEPGERAEDYDGTLIYVKPTFYGTEPRDVCTYANDHPTFPHEATADQFYTESQFESYRALGSYVIELLERTPASGERPDASPFERLAARIREVT